MNDEELLQQQVEISTNASLGQTVWVYRGSMWGKSSEFNEVAVRV
jgi:hypothetical protein